MMIQMITKLTAYGGWEEEGAGSVGPRMDKQRTQGALFLTPVPEGPVSQWGDGCLLSGLRYGASPLLYRSDLNLQRLAWTDDVLHLIVSKWFLTL